jgi:hypothetical protein
MPFGSANQEDVVASSIFFEGFFVLILNKTLKQEPMFIELS